MYQRNVTNTTRVDASNVSSLWNSATSTYLHCLCVSLSFVCLPQFFRMSGPFWHFVIHICKCNQELVALPFAKTTHIVSETTLFPFPVAKNVHVYVNNNFVLKSFTTPIHIHIPIPTFSFEINKKI